MRTIFKIQLHPCPPNPGTAVNGVHRHSKNLRKASKTPLTKRPGYRAVLPLISFNRRKLRPGIGLIGHAGFTNVGAMLAAGNMGGAPGPTGGGTHMLIPDAAGKALSPLPAQRLSANHGRGGGGGT